MQIAVLEWICGGGLSPIENEPSSELAELEREGWAMLACVASQLATAGHRVRVPLSTQFQHALPTQTAFEITRVEPSGERLRPPRAWIELAQAADLTIVIAPECDSILTDCLAELRKAACRLWNCSGDFLSSTSCKWQTSQRFRLHSIPHPPTQLVQQVDHEWCRMVCDQLGCRLEDSRWVIKPVDGAGATDLRIVDADRLFGIVAAWRSESVRRVGCSAIVQPWLNGRAMSCSGLALPAIPFSSVGGRLETTYQWLPLMTQEFSWQASTGEAKLAYAGGVLVEDPHGRLPPHAELLNRACQACGPGAAGWIGVDLLFAESPQQWYVIEINPRLTSSVTTLCAAYDGNLMDDLISWLGQSGH